LALYFDQSQQRIARCEYCWGYFIPKTRKATRYCDRIIDGFSRKRIGSRFQRNEGTEKDEALSVCKQLRDRMYTRYVCYRDAALDGRSKLIPMDLKQYDAWSENAWLARMEYLDGKLTAEKFFRRIDTTHELMSYEAGKITFVVETAWQKRAAHSVGFDRETAYPEEMLLLDLREPDAKWECLTADDLRRRDQKGHQSLWEKYGKTKTRPGAISLNRSWPFFDMV